MALMGMQAEEKHKGRRHSSQRHSGVLLPSVADRGIGGALLVK